MDTLKGKHSGYAGQLYLGGRTVDDINEASSLMMDKGAVRKGWRVRPVPQRRHDAPVLIPYANQPETKRPFPQRLLRGNPQMQGELVNFDYEGNVDRHSHLRRLLAIADRSDAAKDGGGGGGEGKAVAIEDEVPAAAKDR